MNTASKGRRNEHRGRDFFEKRGFIVVRSAGSFGPADLTMFGKGEVWFVNGKTNQWAPPAEREALKGLARKVSKQGIPAIAVLMRFDDGDTEPKFKAWNPKDRSCANDYIEFEFGPPNKRTSDERSSCEGESIARH